MDHQQLILTLFGVAGFCVAWWVNTIWGMVKSQQEQITAVNMKLATSYVQKDDLDKTFTKIFDTLDEVRKEVMHISRNQTSVATMKDLLERVKP